MFLSVHPHLHQAIRMKQVTKKLNMPDENLSPQSQDESIGGEKEEEAEARRNVSRGGYSPHSTTTTGTTPPSRKRHQTPKDEQDQDEEMADAHAGESTDVDPLMADQTTTTTTPLKQVLVATLKLSSSISRQHSDRALQIVTDLLIGVIDSSEFQQRVSETVHLSFRSFVPPLLDRQLNGLRRELAARLHPARLLAQQTTASQTTKEHVKALLLLDSQLQSLHQDSTSESSSSSSTSQQQLSVWQVFRPGAAEAQAGSHPAGSETAAAADQSVTEATQLVHQQNGTTRKRRASASLIENSGGGDDVVEETRKRVALYSTHPPVWMPPKENGSQHQHPMASVAVGGPREMSSTKMLSASCYPSNPMASFQSQQGDEEWANIHTMLNCILSMVEKTRRALGILQHRASNDNQVQQQKRRDSSTSLHHQQQVTYEASELRRQAGELIAQTLKATEDRVNQVKRKAEEAVHDVRRAAMIELQRALSAERLRAERLAAEARRQGAEEALSALGQHAMMGSGHHPTSPANKELCWNCGRRANETCSGCNVARYCSTFCQHKHWEVHHKICGRVSQVMLAAAAPSSSIEHQSESGSPSSSSQQRSGHRNNSKTPSPVQQQTSSSASFVH
ncbi:protein CBFA2T3 isoform X3 [Daphnia magna]|uniref:protein CBFA2T3 isoform X3 n=1 Tax=Daphnia magna TaxID=35525 RepID=UPI001E1BA4BD|nr:protein CBFA2T3 isoform X3 [Daphnia magna]